MLKTDKETVERVLMLAALARDDPRKARRSIRQLYFRTLDTAYARKDIALALAVMWLLEPQMLRKTPPKGPLRSMKSRANSN